MAGTSYASAPVKDPRITARKYQLDLCKKAVEENIIVYLGTGCGKTHIAVLLMYELGHLIRKPSKNICVFLAPTVPLVRQQALVIENSADFTVQCYYGNRKHLKSHNDWDKEIEQSEILVMTPQILLHNLRHCFIRMELIALLIFDECHHAQAAKRHPYAQIMKEFYKTNTMKSPRVFGMTASPIIGKGGLNPLNYTKCINSLENLLDAKVCSVDDNLELESIVASPDIKVYFYGPVVKTDSSFNSNCCKKLEEIKNECITIIREKTGDQSELQKKMRLLWRMNDNLLFCLENIGLFGAIQAARFLLTAEGFDSIERETGNSNSDNCLADQYLTKAASVLNCDLLDDCNGSDDFALEALEEPFFSRKLSVLIGILSTYRLKANMKCIIFVKRIIIARSLVYILRSLESLDFWKCEFLVGFHSGLRNMSRKTMNAIVEKFRSGEVNLLVATNVAEEGLDIQTCCLVVRFDLPETVASFIQSRGRARMLKSEYVFLVERGNQRDEKLLKDFMSSEDIMNREIVCRTSNETFDDLEETIYKVDATGASISTGCSVSLLHRYCAKLPRDIYFTPKPKFFYIDDLGGTVCSLILPANAPLRQVDGQPCPSKDEARRAACLKACTELHARGALSEYLLPGPANDKKKGSAQRSECDSSEDEYLREELHEMAIPAALRVPWTNFENHIHMYFYYIKFYPIPEDRQYRKFGLFIKTALPKEAETMEVDLHLAHGRIVKTGFLPSGMKTFDRDEITLAQNFQEMFLKIILDRSKFFSDFVSLGKNDASQLSSSTFYLLLPVKQHGFGDSMIIDWTTVRCCLSSPVFGHPQDSSEKSLIPMKNNLELQNGPINKCDILNSLVFTPHSKAFFFIDGILDETNANSQYNVSGVAYADHYKEKFGIQLMYPEQPFLKAKQLFNVRNLLHNRVQENTAAHELEEHFLELPPEVCLLKIVGFSKDIGSSVSLLPSLMHRLENLLVAIELKEVLSTSFPEATEIRADRVLEALTTEKCLERFSLERFEVLGDAFLKYVVGRHSFLSYEALDEGQLTMKRSSIVNNSNLYELAVRNNLQVYIHDELFDPSQFFALGHPCTVVCNAETESTIHCQRRNDTTANEAEASNVTCSKSHRWLQKKTIADAVEALIGAFLVEIGFKAAIAFLRWIGIQVDFEVSDVYRICKESKNNMSLIDIIDVATLEKLVGYRFLHRGLLLQAFVHPSYNKHSGGCYQRLEFLGDAVLEYLITSYLYSIYPELKPGQITDLRSLIVNNNSFAHIAVRRSFHLYLVKDSSSLSEAINNFESFVHLPDSEKDELACPKVLGDVVESCIGAILLDTGFNLEHVWRIMLTHLDPGSFSSWQINPIRELRELCQSYGFELQLPDPVKQKRGYLVEVEVNAKGKSLTYSASNHSSKTARRTAAQAALSKLKMDHYNAGLGSFGDVTARNAILTTLPGNLGGYPRIPMSCFQELLWRIKGCEVLDLIHAVENERLGYKHKSKSLEEILRSTRKGEAKLIGFDEEPIIIDNTESLQLEKLLLQEAEKGKLHAAGGTLSHYGASSSRILHNQSSLPLRSLEWHQAETSEATDGNEDKHKPVAPHQTETSGATNGNKHQYKPGGDQAEETSEVNGGVLGSKTARSRLFEVCAANYWSPPSFVCCKEEGPDHLRMYTFKVTMEVEAATSTVLECFSEPFPKKKAAQEHAAQGALWYLKHQELLR